MLHSSSYEIFLKIYKLLRRDGKDDTKEQWKVITEQKEEKKLWRLLKHNRFGKNLKVDDGIDSRKNKLVSVIKPSKGLYFVEKLFLF